MPTFRRDTDQWSDRPPADGDGLCVQVVPPGTDDASTGGDGPAVQFFDGSRAGFRLTDAVPLTDVATAHTVAAVDPGAAGGRLVAGLRVAGDTVSVDALGEGKDGGAIDRLREALDEILIPVYIDDAAAEASKAVNGLLALLTVQRDPAADRGAGRCTYARAAAFEDGDLLLEHESGEISM
jgi:hypothetical protein